jgi:hypothetical protein
MKTVLFLAVLLGGHVICSGQQINLRDDVSYDHTTYRGDEFAAVYMSKKNGRIKAKYFAAEGSGGSVYNRYQQWSRGRDIIAVTSGTYMDECEAYKNPKPVGLTVDNGLLVNRSYEPKLGGLIIVQATGGIATSKIKDGDLEVVCGYGGKKRFNIESSWDRSAFIDCAEDIAATVFQAHLLVWKDKLNVSRADPNKRERRFLAVGYDWSEPRNIVYTLVHLPDYITLYDGTVKARDIVMDYYRMKEMVFLINLDTGCQDIFRIYDRNGREMDMKGEQPLSQAANLLVFYYE